MSKGSSRVPRDVEAKNSRPRDEVWSERRPMPEAWNLIFCGMSGAGTPGFKGFRKDELLIVLASDCSICFPLHAWQLLTW